MGPRADRDSSATTTTVHGGEHASPPSTTTTTVPGGERASDSSLRPPRRSRPPRPRRQSPATTTTTTPAGLLGRGPRPPRRRPRPRPFVCAFGRLDTAGHLHLHLHVKPWCRGDSGIHGEPAGAMPERTPWGPPSSSSTPGTTQQPPQRQENESATGGTCSPGPVTFLSPGRSRGVTPRRGGRMVRAPARSSSTLAAWPSARTSYRARVMTPLGSTRNMERMVPTVFFPYGLLAPGAVLRHHLVVGSEAQEFQPFLSAELSMLLRAVGGDAHTSAPAPLKPWRLSLNWQASLVHPGVSSAR